MMLTVLCDRGAAGGGDRAHALRAKLLAVWLRPGGMGV